MLKESRGALSSRSQSEIQPKSPIVSRRKLVQNKLHKKQNASGDSATRESSRTLRCGFDDYFTSYLQRHQSMEQMQLGGGSSMTRSATNRSPVDFNMKGVIRPASGPNDKEIMSKTMKFK